MKAMPKYRCHKEVQALQIMMATKDPDGTVLLEFPQGKGFTPRRVEAAVVSRCFPQPGDYFVVYADGYESISPKKAFEDGYAPATKAKASVVPMAAPSLSVEWLKLEILKIAHQNGMSVEHLEQRYKAYEKLVLGAGEDQVS